MAEEDLALGYGLLDPDQGEPELLRDGPQRLRPLAMEVDPGLDERERDPLLQQPRAGGVADLPELLVGEPAADDPATALRLAPLYRVSLGFYLDHTSLGAAFEPEFRLKPWYVFVFAEVPWELPESLHPIVGEAEFLHFGFFFVR